ncbi:hypothetical protein C8A03DRAFT_14086 [Achaetomium macrosporum]|uniref:Uncharacterized protein n=1 Tax=Achaetomium macrosporum TaxID=79813 RepID=A0AAN7CDY3_9PEZI|nr:hypothetical protein C8A03DRAFT_14086 [Achaetomium macrosporum]
MSVVGKRKNPDANSGRMPPIVVSRKPIDAASAPPKASPRRPGRRKKSDRDEQQQEIMGGGKTGIKQSTGSNPRSSSLVPVEIATGNSKQGRSRDMRTTTPASFAETLSSASEEELRGSTALWSADNNKAKRTYVAGLEMNTVKLPPSPPEEDPVENDGEERDSNSEGESESDGNSLDAAMASTASFPTTTRDGSGYRTALPARAAGRPRMVSIRKLKPDRATTPATKTKRQSSIRRIAAKLESEAARREAAVYTKPSERLVDEEEDYQAAENQSTITASTTTNASTRTRRSRRLLEQQKEQEEEQRSSQESSSKVRGAKNGDSSPPPTKTSKLRKKGSSRNPTPKPAENNTSRSIRTDRAAAAAAAPDDAKVQMVKTAAGGMVPSLSVRMADWEIAPGRIRVGTGEDAENLAFSSSYLAQGRAVPVSDGITFQMLEIQPGAHLSWPAEESRTRLCSVARGIIRVKLPEKEFPIGPNGMWKVKQGVYCTVVNPFYVGAVVHVTMIGEEGY